MKREMSYIAATVVLCLSAGLAGASASSGAEPTNANRQAEAKPTTTIVGCLVQGLPSKPEGSDFFVRTPTMKVPPGTPVAIGTPGTGSTASASGTPAEDSFYRIAGLAADQLRPHLGHRVEVHGRLTDNMPGVESQRATTKQEKDGRATTTVETRIEVAGVLHATSVKMVSADCTK
jgi:hypothetical protein